LVGELVLEVLLPRKFTAAYPIANDKEERFDVVLKMKLALKQSPLRAKHQITFEVPELPLQLLDLELGHDSEVDEREGVGIVVVASRHALLHANIFWLQVPMHVIIEMKNLKDFDQLPEHRKRELLPLFHPKLSAQCFTFYNSLEVFPHVEHLELGHFVSKFVPEREGKSHQNVSISIVFILIVVDQGTKMLRRLVDSGTEDLTGLLIEEKNLELFDK